MKTKELEYLAKEKRCEGRAAYTHRPEGREWQLVLARAYRMLSESEVEVAAQRKRQEPHLNLGRIAYRSAGFWGRGAAVTSRRSGPRFIRSRSSSRLSSGATRRAKISLSWAKARCRVLRSASGATEDLCISCFPSP